MADLLATSAKEIRSGLAELEPLVAEHERLKEALAAHERVIESDGGQRRRARRRSQSRGDGRPSGRRKAGGRRSTRAGRRGATRAERFLGLVEKQPGITVAEAAKRLRTTPASLYQVTSRLRKEGRVRRERRGFHKSG